MNITLVSQDHRPAGLPSPSRQPVWEYGEMQVEDKRVCREYLSQVLAGRLDPGEGPRRGHTGTI